MYRDTHTHITGENFVEELKEAKEEGLDKIILVATSVEEIQPVLSYKSDLVECAYGIFPSDEKEVNEDLLKDLDERMSSNDFIAVGEIGLDYYWYKDNRETQMEMFKRQIQIADKHNLPIVVHTRDSIQDAYNVMKQTPCKRKGMLHCYSGSLEMAKEFIKLGYYISLGGVLTFKNSKETKRVLQGIDLNYLLFETDAPYLTPTPFRGTPNKTSYVKLVYKYAAELLEMDEEELKQIVKNNFNRLFYGKD